MACSGRRVFLAALLVGLALVAASCGHESALTDSTHLAGVADLTLTKGRPGNVRVRLDAERYLQITVVTERPVRSCTLSRVAASDGSAVSEQPVAVEETPHSQGQGGKTYAWITTDTVAPGTYRVRLLGEGRVVSLVVDMASWE